MIATSRENVFYCSGVWAGIPLRLAPVIIPLDKDPVILVHPSGSGAGEDITVRKTTWIKDVRTYQGGEWAPLFVWDAIKNVLIEKTCEQLQLYTIKINLGYVRHIPGFSSG